MGRGGRGKGGRNCKAIQKVNVARCVCYLVLVCYWLLTLGVHAQRGLQYLVSVSVCVCLCVCLSVSVTQHLTLHMIMCATNDTNLSGG